jgi:hypothetical protein
LEPYIDLRYIESAEQAADIFTKAFTNPEKWRLVTTLINHIDPATFWTAPKEEAIKAMAARISDYSSWADMASAEESIEEGIGNNANITANIGGQEDADDNAGGIAPSTKEDKAMVIGKEIREVKQRLKKNGLTNKQIHDHPEIAALVHRLHSLRDQTPNITALPLQQAYHDHNKELPMRKFTRIDHNSNRFKRATNKGPCWCQCVGRRTTEVGTGKQYECRNTTTMPEAEINGAINKKGDIMTELFWTPSKRWKLPYPCPDCGKTYNNTTTCTPAVPRAIQPTPARTLVELLWTSKQTMHTHALQPQLHTSPSYRRGRRHHTRSEQGVKSSKRRKRTTMGFHALYWGITLDHQKLAERSKNASENTRT